MSETWVTLDCGWLHDKRAEPQMRPTDESKWENEARRYCQNANYWREEGKKAIAREAQLREAIVSFCDAEEWADKTWKDQPHIVVPRRSTQCWAE
jgi:hypothetical protein